MNKKTNEIIKKNKVNFEDIKYLIQNNNFNKLVQIYNNDKIINTVSIIIDNNTYVKYLKNEHILKELIKSNVIKLTEKKIINKNIYYTYKLKKQKKRE